MAAALVGEFALKWLFETYFPLHAEFTERPQPLLQYSRFWQCSCDYRAWAKIILRCLLCGAVPPHRRFEVRFQLQRAGRLAGVCEEIETRDVLRASWILDRPVVPASWGLGFPGGGETDEYLHLVDATLPERPADAPGLPLEGEAPDISPRSLQDAREYMEALVDQHLKGGVWDLGSDSDEDED
ncbi:unnamed protein product [Symbiodinium sp. CCMP2592]|nr:unnamed protein product [Symbiodinium sp. CCMP2592]